MRKKTIAGFYIPGIILFIIGIVVAGIGAAAAVASVNSGSTAVAGGGTVLLGTLIEAVGGILLFVAWIGTLMATGKQGRWGWLVCTILFSIVTMLIYLIAGPGLTDSRG